VLHHLSHPYTLLGVLVAVVVGLFGHNLAQAWTARALGDSSAVRNGYGALDPQRHLEPLGVVCVLLVHFGWGFPAPVPLPTRFRRERTRVAVALAAGPVFLLGLTALAVLLLRAARDQPTGHLFEFGAGAALSAAGLFITSCLPVPPCAVGRIVFLYAPYTPGWQQARYRLVETPMGPLIVLAVLLLPVIFTLLPDVVGQLSGPLVRALARAEGVLGSRNIQT